ncbi:MAG: orotidine-5'-phosphate decarboxylase [Cytophagaceae bacterium]|nr:orotidine-5'-phosphate decarboxylase [Cytophagaceae bacterium]MDW8456057.1 orotidine-5'-phosphate decarboxylase [Cytophagaceae bacterium]
MKREQLIAEIKKKRSYLCIGLDTDIARIPAHLHQAADPIFEFNRQIIDATYAHCVAYKPNTAFYEALGAKGWDSLCKTIEYIPKECLSIADAKRGDIGNTSSFYAKAFFETLKADAITVAPYMGEDSVKPFLEYKNHWTIVLALTSNSGSADFQTRSVGENELYLEVVKKCILWANTDQLMFVAGATKPELIKKIRQLAPDYFLLIPGIGAQGGHIDDVSDAAITPECGLLLNASRSIIYASQEKDFAKKAAEEAILIKKQMEKWLDKSMA